MDLHKLKTEEIKGYDASKFSETERDLRRELLTLRMDIYNPRNKHTAKFRGLRKSLARLLTVKHERAQAPTANQAK